MAGPVKLNINDDGEVTTDREYANRLRQEAADEDAHKLKEDPENYIYRCFHGKRCKHVKMLAKPFPTMLCSVTDQQILLDEGCPKNLWDGKQREVNHTDAFDWYANNRRLHYQRAATAWKKLYGLTRKLPDFILNGMR